jgi:hypothetical protein
LQGQRKCRRKVGRKGLIGLRWKRELGKMAKIDISQANKWYKTKNLTRPIKLKHKLTRPHLSTFQKLKLPANRKSTARV